MNDPVVLGARAAAKRLAAELEPGLRGEVELALQARSRTPEQYVDPIALGALIWISISPDDPKSRWDGLPHVRPRFHRPRRHRTP